MLLGTRDNCIYRRRQHSLCATALLKRLKKGIATLSGVYATVLGFIIDKENTQTTNAIQSLGCWVWSRIGASHDEF